jgi:hypothetical protein
MLENIDFKGLLELFNIKRKRDLDRYCKDLKIYDTDFVELILTGRAGGMTPYLYKAHFMDKVPEHLLPSREEEEALGGSTVGPLEGKAKKFTTKIHQIFQDRRYLAAHLFYTPSHTYWHLFYFDHRDHSGRNNHWKHGPHLHFLNFLWPNQKVADVGST